MVYELIVYTLYFDNITYKMKYWIRALISLYNKNVQSKVTLLFELFKYSKCVLK